MNQGASNVPAIELDQVSVRYGRTAALTDVTAILPVGAVGLLGPNGAGKSTLIRALLGLLKPARGEMRVLGLDVRTSPLAVRARVGYMPEIDVHIPGMTAVAFVAYCGELAGLPQSDAVQRSHEVLYYVGLEEVRYRASETYSGGMKQRLKLAQALVHDPDLVFLDEPTNGMDPAGREEMLALVRDLAHNKGVTVILSSHVLPDVDGTCDHVVVLDKGRVVAQGPIDSMKGHGRHLYELRVKGDRQQFCSALRTAGIDCPTSEDETMRVSLSEGYDTRILFQIASQHGMQIRHLRPSVPTLEDAFTRALTDADP